MKKASGNRSRDEIFRDILENAMESGRGGIKKTSLLVASKLSYDHAKWYFRELERKRLIVIGSSGAGAERSDEIIIRITPEGIAYLKALRQLMDMLGHRHPDAGG